MIEHEEGRTRIVIEGVTPEIDGGRFPIKRIVGDRVVIEVDIFADGHDVLSSLLLYRTEDDPNWSSVPMELLVNDRWRGSFVVTKLGRYRYTLTAWVNRFKAIRFMMAAMCLEPSMKSASLICSSGACGREPGYATPIKTVGSPRVSVKEYIGPLPAIEGTITGSSP